MCKTTAGKPQEARVRIELSWPRELGEREVSTRAFKLWWGLERFPPLVLEVQSFQIAYSFAVQDGKFFFHLGSWTLPICTAHPKPLSSVSPCLLNLEPSLANKSPSRLHGWTEVHVLRKSLFLSSAFIPSPLCSSLDKWHVLSLSCQAGIGDPSRHIGCVKFSEGRQASARKSGAVCYLDKLLPSLSLHFHLGNSTSFTHHAGIQRVKVLTRQ